MSRVRASPEGAWEGRRSRLLLAPSRRTASPARRRWIASQSGRGWASESIQPKGSRLLSLARQKREREAWRCQNRQRPADQVDVHTGPGIAGKSSASQDRRQTTEAPIAARADPTGWWADRVAGARSKPDLPERWIHPAEPDAARPPGDPVAVLQSPERPAPAR